VDVPAQPVLDPGALGDQVLTVIYEQLELPGRLIQLGGGQVGFAQRGPRHRQRIDRIGLARGPDRGSGGSHQLGRHAHDPLTNREQVPLQAARHVPAVLHRPGPLTGDGPSPGDQLQVLWGTRRDGALGDLPAEFLHGHDGVGGLVRIDAEHGETAWCGGRHRGSSVWSGCADEGPAGRHTSVEAMAMLL
jgi:hypothetical protein